MREIKAFLKYKYVTTHIKQIDIDSLDFSIFNLMKLLLIICTNNYMH